MNTAQTDTTAPADGAKGPVCRASDGALSIRNAGKIYDPEGVHVEALKDCSLEIEAGEFVAIVGPSGCGKSTLLNALAGFDGITSGEILLDGEPLATPELDPRPGPDRVVVFQHGALFPWKTVLENVTYGPVVQGIMSQEQANKRAQEMLSRVGLNDIETSYPGQLSSGMQRRVEIIRALINNPRVLLLDEPFRAMDTVTKSASHQYLLELYSATGKTIFFITHDLEEAIFLADKVLVMTTRPGYIKKTLQVKLPRPRQYSMLASEEFLAMKAQLVEAVHEEAVKAFEAGEREMA
ncbi:MAG: ABC transporter ATP-binding protein [Desulfarculaceae bacterium]|nr:ABC transporter ATP-binding protein [Desulfarculaceae bacterium]MCF8073208.1 ABC transporter ATP-binding protein [Desulfarculaceae bacterium]MCF8100804.1 ABC transporter ATP-binding protein [Desulfarculaceae bacterium]MCF8118451.1 ABC transporter ATP-binding protein [Desulfarculaceae bacterium]